MDLFIKVKAEGVDEIAKSTIPFSPNSTTSTPFPSGTTTTPVVIDSDPAIFLETEKLQLLPNEIISVRVRIDTKGVFIKSFKTNIKYDPTFLQINDENANLDNIQVFYKDTYFIEGQNETDTSTGSITISGNAPDGNPAVVSGRDVAEIRFLVLKEGLTSINVVIENSSLLDANNTDISRTHSNQKLDFIISNSNTTTFPELTTSITPSGTLPRNGIFDTFGTSQAIILGALFVTIGAYLYKITQNANKEN